MADIMASGLFLRHVAQMRKRYAQRRALLIAALETAFAGRLQVIVPPGGLQILARLPEGVCPVEASRRADAAGIHLRETSSTHVETAPSGLLQIGFAAVPEAEIAPAAARLASALRGLF
jgi:GntR family transcriptional regulator/MocR family aminotransferase